MENQSQRHTGWVTAILTGSTFLTGIDLFIVNVAFGEIGRDLGTSSLGELSWVLSAYAVVFAALLVPMGRLTDRYGRKSGFVAGLGLFTLASLLCGFAPGIWWLVAFRALQAVGAAAMTPSSLGLLLAALPPERRAGGARLWAMTGALAAAFGPAVGGGLVEISWRWAFWINVPIGIVVMIAAIRLVPDVRHNAGAPHPDFIGALVITIAVGALVLGIVQGNDWGWWSTGVLASWAVAALGLAIFVRRILTHDAPLIEPDLFRVRAFTWANIAAVIFNLGFGMALLSRILWLQQVWGYTALQTGFAVAVGPLAVPVTALLAGRFLLGRISPSRLIALGTFLFAISGVWMIAVVTPTPDFVGAMLWPWVLGGIGVGFAMPFLVAAATASLPPERAATGSGVASMARQLGLVLGTSILVGVLGGGSVAEFHHVWWVMTLASLVAGAAAWAIEPIRRTTVAVVTP